MSRGQKFEMKETGGELLSTFGMNALEDLN